MATFTKQHFQSVAHLLRFRLERAQERQGVVRAVTVNDAQELISSFAILFAEGNPRFNHARFLRACGLEG